MELEDFLDSINAPAAVYEIEKGFLHVGYYWDEEGTDCRYVDDISYILFSDSSYRFSHLYTSVRSDWADDIFIYLWYLRYLSLASCPTWVSVIKNSREIWKEKMNHARNFSEWCERNQLGLENRRDFVRAD